MGLDIKGKWTLGGSLPGEPIQAQELGVGMPKQGLWLREDVDMRCNFVMTSFVKKTLKKAHATLVDRLLEKAHIIEATVHNNRLINQQHRASSIHSSAAYSQSPSLGPYNTEYSSDVNSVRTTSPMQSPRIPYSHHTPGGSTIMGSPSPSYQSIDPAYQEAAQTMKYVQFPDGRISYIPPQQTNRQSYVPQYPSARGLAVELPADDGMLLYPQQQPPFQRDLRSEYGSQHSQHSQYSQPMHTPPIQELQPKTPITGDTKGPIIPELHSKAPVDDRMKRYQLNDLQPRALNVSRSPPPEGQKYVPPADPNVNEMPA
jgi:hypothetical protein